MKNTLFGSIYLTLAASIWGGMYVVVKVVVAVIPPLELVWLRYAVALLSLLILSLFTRQSWKVHKRDLLLIAAIGDRQHDFDRHAGNRHEIINRADGCDYYGIHSRIYGCICPADVERAVNAEKRNIDRAGDDRSIAHCGERRSRYVEPARRSLASGCGADMGFDVRADETGSRPLLTACRHNVFHLRRICHPDPVYSGPASGDSFVSACPA